MYIIVFTRVLDLFIVMQLTNVVVQGNLVCTVDLERLARDLVNVKYHPCRFSGLVWQHRRIGGNCLVFSTGVIITNGKSRSFEEGIQRLRRYARLLQKKGYCNALTRVKVVTASASHRLETSVKLENVPFPYTYEPELFPAAMFRREGIHFTLHLSGALLVTGIKRPEDFDGVVYPVILELCL